MQAKTLLDPKRSTKYLVAIVLAITAAWTVASFAAAVPAQAEPLSQPKTTHDVAGRENCLACHPVGGGVKPSPASHASYSNAMCLNCHPVGSAAADPAPAAPTAAAPAGPVAEPTKPAAPSPTQAAESQSAPAATAPPSPAAAAPTTAPPRGPDCAHCPSAASGPGRAGPGRRPGLPRLPQQQGHVYAAVQR